MAREKKLLKLHVGPGDRVQWSYFGKNGAFGTVVSIHPKEHVGLGGVRGYVKVRWENGHQGSVEDRVLKLIEKAKP